LAGWTVSTFWPAHKPPLGFRILHLFSNLFWLGGTVALN
jgi:hypothetical protein